MKNKGLIVYFSIYGTTKKFAEEIHRQTGFPIERIVPSVEYNSNKENYEELVELAKVEHDNNIRVPINDIDTSDYEIIFIGYPIWWETFPNCIKTFIDTHDLEGKTIIPFNTHEGSKEGSSYDDIKLLLPKSLVLDGLEIRGSKMIYDQSFEVEEWLKRINIIDK